MRARRFRFSFARAHAFTLLEVVAAVAIFSLGMVALLGLFAPVTKTVANSADAEAAGRVADSLRARLHAMPFETALALIQNPADVRRKDADGAYNPNDGAKHPAVIFGQLNGEIGIYSTPASGRPGWFDSQNSDIPMSDREKFFEIDLIRNTALTPAEADDLAPMVAYTMRVRWPAFLPTATAGGFVQVGANPAAGGSVPYDHGKKQVMFFTGALRR